MPKDISDDEFVERIGYRETRNYIKRVLRNYYVYQDMYGS
jgi:soluble lytic murein transglycosylase-like protein